MMFEPIKSAIRNSLFYELIRPALQKKQLRRWGKNGKTGVARIYTESFTRKIQKG